MALEKRRIDCFDIAKGIGILLVIFGHLSTDEQFARNFVYAFHMPVFFFVSGLFAKEKSAFSECLKKSARTLYVPFAFAIAVDAAIIFAKKLVGSGLDIKDFLFSFAIAAAGFKDPALNTPVWFLLSLMVIRLIFCLISQIKNKTGFYITLGGFTAFCALTVMLFKSFSLPVQWVYVKSFAGFCFYAAGFFLKRYVMKFTVVFEGKKRIFNVSCLIAAAVLAFLVKINGSVSIYKCAYSNPFLFFINAFLGIFIVLAVCENIDQKTVKIKKMLVFYGRNSVAVLLTHYYAARIIIPAAFKFAKIEDYLYNPFVELLLFVLISAAMVPVIMFFNKFLYFVIGNKKPGSAKE